MNSDKVEIIRVPVLPFKIVNAYIVKSSKGCILVDAGLPNTEHKFKKILDRHQLKWTDIKLIVITHAHVDHAGGAFSIKELSGAPIVAHQGDLKHLTREIPMTFCSTSWFGKLFIKTNLMIEPYKGFTPDILLKDAETLELSKYGVKGFVKFTPGHTAGSISVVLDNNEALVGDLLTSGIFIGGIMFNNIPKRPPFEDDPIIVAKELEKLNRTGIKKFYLGHGGPLNSKAVADHILTLSELKK